MRSALVAALLLFAVPAHAQLVAAVLPSSRAVAVGTPATAYATIINAGATTAIGCSIAPVTPVVGATFSYQATDPTTNQPTGTPNMPVNIAASGWQSFVIAFDFASGYANAGLVPFIFDCVNTDPAPVILDVNTLRLAARAHPVEVLAIGVTPTHDGIVNVPPAPGFGVFAFAAMNIGTWHQAFGYINITTVSPVSVWMCETNPLTGACLGPPAPISPPGWSKSLDAGEVATFSLFVQRTGSAPFDPATQRIFVNFTSRIGPVTLVYVNDGVTSVAVRTEP